MVTHSNILAWEIPWTEIPWLAPVQRSHLENPINRGAWQVTVHGITRVGNNLVTKPPPSKLLRTFILQLNAKAQ